MAKQVAFQFRYRSAVTGRWVTEAYARRHPKTTIREGFNRFLKKSKR